MIKKISLPVLVTIMCVMLLGVVVLTYLNRGYFSKIFNKGKTVQKTEEVKITRTDYSQTARKTLDWIDKQRGEDGWYILERGCDLKAKTCDTVWNNEEGNKDGLIATWARFNFYNQTKDPKDLEIVKSDINKFYEKYPNGVDNALWICKITYDMWSSKLFDQTTKDKLEKICFSSQFPTPEEVKEYWNGGKDKEVEKISSSTKKSWENWNGYSLNLRGFDANFGYVIDMLSKYEWKKDKTYLDLAKRYLILEQGLYESKIDDPENVCLLGISSFFLYKDTNDQNYLNYTQKIFEDKIVNYETRLQYQTTLCGFLTKLLYKETKNQDILIFLEMNNRVVIELKMDGNNTQIMNDNSFFKSNGKNDMVFYKNIVENSLVSESLRN